MTLPLESTRVIIVAGVHFQVISAGNTPEIVTICGMVDTLSIDACQISNPRKSVAGTFHKKQINCDNIRIPDSALVRVKVMTLGARVNYYDSSLAMHCTEFSEERHFALRTALLVQTGCPEFEGSFSVCSQNEPKKSLFLFRL